jgi:Protein of unknown function (DUF3089)
MVSVVGRQVARTLRAGCLAGAVAAGVLTTGAPGAGSATRPLRAGSSTVWLCNPKQATDPCTTSRAATAVSGQGTTSASLARSSSAATRFDCFYVYPTVSTEPGVNADLTVQAAERAAAVVQASRFSQRCTVWAPMYRQITVAGLERATKTALATAYDSLLSAWKDYLAHDNHGRPIVFIGHSQGSAMLINLLKSQVDPSPTLRKRMVSAILLGGNVQVPTGRVVGGTFRNIPACGSASQTGCIIAYSSFGSPPPANSLFGRAGRGVSALSGQAGAGSQQVVCVNPVTFSARAGSLQPFFWSATARTPGVRVLTPWVTFPGLYTAQCQRSDGASWLQVTATRVPGDPRPTVSASLGPLWGYHLDDVNLALGNLVTDVGLEEAAYG